MTASDRPHQFRSLSRQQWLRAIMVPVVLGVLLAPLVILAHEFGHYLAGYFMDLRPTLYSSLTEVSRWPEDKFRQIIFSAAGPMVEVILTIGGFLWLRSRRRGRPSSSSNSLDWLATFMAWCCLRWVSAGPGVVWRASTTGMYRADEAKISLLLGLPGWLIPVGLCLLSVWLVIATVRLHPVRQRLLPFLILFAGMVIGALGWLTFLGPAIFGAQPLLGGVKAS